MALVEAPPPTELLVDPQPAPGDASDGGGSGMAPIVLPVLLAGLSAKFLSPTVALAVLGAGAVLFIARRKPRHGRFILRIADGILEVARERGASPPIQLPLAEVLDVTLDRQAKAASGRGGVASERVQITLERAAPADPIHFPDDRITPIEAQEWQGKVRVFLRKHGWLPKEERRA
jgi:hypothetical protein